MKLILENWDKFVNENEEAITEAQITDQTSFGAFRGEKGAQLAAKLMSELIKGGPLFKELQTAQLGKWYTTESPEVLKNWVESIGGIEVFAKRASAIGDKIPEKGLPKSKMPFLPGPEDATGDVKDVEDALTPGGKYNVDMMEKTNPPAPNAIGMVGKDPNANKFMTGGLGVNDGDENDDSIKIELGGGFPAAKGIPTQTNILLPKALGMAVKGLKGGDLDAYASLKGHILDGHHRWAATMLNDPSAKIGTVARVDLDTLGTEETLKYLTAIGNALGNKTKTK